MLPVLKNSKKYQKYSAFYLLIYTSLNIFDNGYILHPLATTQLFSLQNNLRIYTHTKQFNL